MPRAPERSSGTSRRKGDHLKITLSRDVGSEVTAGWENIRLPHVALPEINYGEVSLETSFLGLSFKAPFLISAMTGGTPRADALNFRLAAFAARRGLPLALGSQRYLLEKKPRLKRLPLRVAVPKVILFSNLGAVQLNYGVKVDDVRALVDASEAQALVLHLNPLQEAVQLEGDRNFSGLYAKIETLKKSLSVPLLVKETGCGISVPVAARLQACGVDGIDVAGLGGTHWGFIEGLRSPGRRRLGEEFRNWGIPTSEVVPELRAALGPRFPLVASGGLRSGLDAAKAFYLGADVAGLALPFLLAAQKSERDLNDFLDHLEEALKIALFCSGSRTIQHLKEARNAT